MGMVWQAIFGAFDNSSHNVSMMVSLHEYTIGIYLVNMCLWRLTQMFAFSARFTVHCVSAPQSPAHSSFCGSHDYWYGTQRLCVRVGVCVCGCVWRQAALRWRRAVVEPTLVTQHRKADGSSLNNVRVCVFTNASEDTWCVCMHG